MSPPAPEPLWVTDVRAIDPPAQARSWLEEPGLLTERVRACCNGPFELRIVAQRRDSLGPSDAATLDCEPAGAFIREIEMGSAGRVLVFAQTLVPGNTLARESWLARLGDDALGPRLARMGGAVREPLEFAHLEPAHALFARAWRRLPIPQSLWARRARYRLGGGSLIVQEVFLPEALG